MKCLPRSAGTDLCCESVEITYLIQLHKYLVKSHRKIMPSSHDFRRFPQFVKPQWNQYTATTAITLKQVIRMHTKDRLHHEQTAFRSTIVYSFAEKTNDINSQKTLLSERGFLRVNRLYTSSKGYPGSFIPDKSREFPPLGYWSHKLGWLISWWSRR